MRSCGADDGGGDWCEEGFRREEDDDRAGARRGRGEERGAEARGGKGREEGAVRRDERLAVGEGGRMTEAAAVLVAAASARR
mmetsp:Transcript_11895/g.50077  ORF Transcript_11895/g.50077 Transcript_11895/m.50077 type:complete len:82 (-) Transcript_11895:158-403(-)